MNTIINKIFIKFLFIFIIVFSYSCSNDDESAPITEEIEVIDPITVNNPIIGETGKIIALDDKKIAKGYILINDIENARVYLMDKLNATIKHEWTLTSRLGNDVVLLNNGKLLASLKDENSFYSIGGYGGKIQIINPDSSIDWEFNYSNEQYLSHHDIELLPNGNILVMAWKIKTILEGEEAGYDISNPNEILMPESVIEINPETKEIVWEWDSWDHLVQNHDSTKNNFGDINENPQLIDINYHYDDRGDIMHANGMDYDPSTDLIYLSVNFYSEIWVIDHSTTTAQAATHQGGNFNKGGDLVYRFGNPTTYKNTVGQRLFYNNHFPNILVDGEIGAGNMLMYMNGNIPENEQSKVYELNLPENLTLSPDQDNEPKIIWEFTDAELYSPLVSGAVRLANGNTLITEGAFGFWEVNNNKEVVWKFDGNSGLYWRGYHYDYNDPGVINLDL